MRKRLVTSVLFAQKLLWEWLKRFTSPARDSSEASAAMTHLEERSGAAAADTPVKHQCVSETDAPKKDLQLEEVWARSRRVREQVPDLGKSWRWYDVVYRTLHWCAWSWPRKILPHPARMALFRGMNFVIPFHDIQTKKVRELDDPHYNLLIPEGEFVTQGGLWAVEFFPPSQYSDLERQLKSNGWDKDGAIYRTGSNAEMVAEARTGQGWSWTRIAEVRNPNAALGVSSVLQPLPKEFSSAEVNAVQIGKSLTAVVAFFTFSELGAKSLDTAWRTPREPYLVTHGLKRADVVDRRIASIRATKAERRRLHGQARRWLESNCRGYFATTRERQPVIDLTLFHNYDPLTHDRRMIDMGDSLDALGLSAGHLLYVSPQLPGGTFVPEDRLRGPLFQSVENCWGFIGSVESMQAEGRGAYGPKPWSAATIAHMSDEAMRAFLLRVAAHKYLQELRVTYVRARDSARATHGRYSASRLKNLRSEMLQTSLDLHVVARDLATLWDNPYLNMQVTIQDRPDVKQEHRLPSFDFAADLRQRQSEGFKELIEEDAAYRELMVTVASLGSSAEASQLSKTALVVAAVSLLVAALTLLLADIADESLLATLLDWWQV